MISAQTTVQKILNVSETYYEIPNFQRPYSWQQKNANDFLADLEESVTRKKSHYFGTVVLVEDTESSYSMAVIDGQQRITTALLMVTAIYHIVKKNPSLINNNETTPELIRDRYLFNANIDKNKVKLRTVTADNEILQRIFDRDGEESRLTQKDRLSNLYQVYSTFRKYFTNKQGLDTYIEGLRYFEVISITLNQNDDDPQRVFESINSTGKPLTDGDKIRNFALMLKSNTLRNHVYKKYWSLIEESLIDANKDYITDFFRSYIISKRATMVRLDTVYSQFKKQFYQCVSEAQTPEDIDLFYSEITEALRFYKLLKLDDTNKFAGEYTGIAETVFKMRYLQIDLYIPFAINVLHFHAQSKITTSQLEEVFNIIEIYFSRRIVIGIPTTSVDRMLAPLHKDILKYTKENGTSYVEVLKYLLLNRIGQTRLPDDVEYEKAIRTREAYHQRNSFLVYVLTSIDQDPKETKTLHYISDGQLKLSVEHVMPQTLTNKDWQLMLGNDYERVHREHLHTLANLTLTGYNSEYSNRPYADKMHLEIKDKKTDTARRVGLAYSSLCINKWIAAHNTWDEKVLIERQDWWVENLKRMWPHPSTNFEPNEEDVSVDLLEKQDLKGRIVRTIEIFGDKFSVSSWAEALDTIVEVLYDRNPELIIDTIDNSDYLSRYIRQDNSAFNNSAEIYETGYFIDTNTDTNSKLRLIRNLGKDLGLSDGNIKAILTITENKGK